MSEYRNDGEHAIWNMGKELVGGICQVQSYCRNWEREAQDAAKNRQLIVDQIETITPKGILIVGNTDELEILSKKESFELFRCNLKTLRSLHSTNFLRGLNTSHLCRYKIYRRPIELEKSSQTVP